MNERNDYYDIKRDRLAEDARREILQLSAAWQRRGRPARLIQKKREE